MDFLKIIFEKKNFVKLGLSLEYNCPSGLLRKVFGLTFICLRSGENCGVFSLDILHAGLDLVNICPDLLHVEEELVHLAPLHRHGHVLAPDIILVRLGLEIVKLSYKSYIK